MHFNLKKHNTAGITYKDDGQIKDNKIVNSNIAFKKPYKLQVRASKMVNERTYKRDGFTVNGKLVGCYGKTKKREGYYG